jgi:starch-binding outer membrane protein, SusD/RagB family
MKKRTLNIYNLLLISGVLLLLTTRCVKLDEKPMDFTGPDNFYQSDSQIESAFASAMNRLYNSWSGYSYAYYYFDSDDQYYSGELVFDDTYANELWQIHYQAIGDINPAILALTKDKLGSSVTQEVKDQLMAQAKFVRAFNYFCLVRLYGDIPIITETTNVVTEEIKRKPIADVYALIESDLLFATQNLPASWPDNPGRPSKDAARALLAKVYITMATAPTNDASNYVKARDMAKAVMEEGVHHLVPDVNQVFALNNSFGPEMMWSFNSTEDDQATNPQIWLPTTMADGWTDIKCDKVFGDTYPDQPRKSAYLLLEDNNGVSYKDPSGWSTWGGPAIKKFLYDTWENQQRLVSVQNYPILRYADALLLFAEAENMVNNGPDQAACDAVNQVIDRANGYVANPEDPQLTTSMTKAEFDAAVIQQRSLELCFEYDRWYDLCRKRILYEKTLPAYQQNFSEDDYLFPIPQTDLRLNPLLTQNPGYTTPTPN